MIGKLRYIFNRREKLHLLAIMILIIIGSLLELLGVSAFLPFIELLMTPDSIETNETIHTVYNMMNFKTVNSFLAFLAVVICIVYVVKNVYLAFMQNSILTFSYKTRMTLSTRLLETYMKEPYTFHLQKNIAELQRSLQTDTMQFMLLINAALQLIAECAVCAVLAVYLFHTSHSITIIIMSLLLICVGFFFIVSKKVSRRLGRQNQEYNGKLFQWINQSLSGIKEVKVLNRESYFIDSYKTVYRKLIKSAKNNELLAALPKYLIETVCICGMLIAVIGKMYFGQRDDFASFIPQLSAFAVASFRLLPSVGKVNSYINSIMYSMSSLDLIYHDLKEIDDCDHIEFAAKDGIVKWKLENLIDIQHISYCYPDTNIPVITDASFAVKKGETIALIGSSGAGKTTMADIILGLLVPTAGKIVVDGKDIYENMSKWHSMIGYIPQTIYLSDDTIRNNIAFGIYESEINDGAIDEALQKAQLYEFVHSLENGLDTVVGDRGVRLSGGQRQRIGIARALYHDPDILVLDEATSALDNETEHAVMEAIDHLHGDKTMIIIAHRLTTIKNADVIYEVGDGQVRSRNKLEIM